MVLLIIDDLDRCAADRVVRLLEAIHTLLRERAAPRRFPVWRQPAKFGVLVLANGAWIRAAFPYGRSMMTLAGREPRPPSQVVLSAIGT
jgi:hypothetical protein